jgi:acetyl-CoA synthetase
MSEIHTFLKEARLFPPPPAFSDKAHIKHLEEYREMYARSISDPDAFWGEQAET